MIVRCPIVPGLTDDLRSLFRFVADLPGVKELHLLPYHRLGEPKHTTLGRQYGLKGTQPPHQRRWGT